MDLSPKINKIELTHEIAGDQLAWRNDSRINRWTRQNGIINEFDMHNWFERVTQDSTVRMFGVKVLSTKLREGQGPSIGEIVGTCGLTSIHHQHRHAEFSLLIAPKYHRQGWGELALKELFRYGFDQLNLHSIWGETFDLNPAIDLFTRIGMKRCGTLRERYFKFGKYVDCHFIEMLRDSYLSQGWRLE